MITKIFASLLIALIGFFSYVSTRNAEFRYEKSGVIQATPDKIFSYISNFQLGSQWNPYAQKDPNMKVNFTGTLGQVGSVMNFDGNNEAGSGSLEILKMTPNESVDIKLIMTKPLKAENLIHYQLTPEGSGTRFSWSMSGNGGYIGKLITLFIDCEKMVTQDFEKGIANLKTLIEAQK